MKKFIFGVAVASGFVLVLGSSIFAQETAGIEQATPVGHTAREEAEGKAVWEKLQAKKLACKDLADDNFGALGEYFMGQMMGSSHEAMNNMMMQMMGEEGEEQMHIVMGKRLSGCDVSASFPPQGAGFMPMMQVLAPYIRQPADRSGMMGGLFAGETGRSSPFGSNRSNNPMMNFGFMPLGGFGWIFMVLWWIFIVAGIIALIRWLINQAQGGHNREKIFDPIQSKSPLEILKERYAKGEIDRGEFEEKKKDLT